MARSQIPTMDVKKALFKGLNIITQKHYNTGGLMTQAELLQQTLLNDFLFRLAKTFETDTDQELKHKFWDAQEEQDGKKIRAIREKINEQHKYE